MGEQPLASVFTAAFEIGPEIDAAYQSIARQTYAEWEWVVVDDSPAPDTGDHVSAIADRDPSGRIRLYRQYPHLGSIGATKAVAASACRGDFLVELDQDDELHPEALAIIVNTFLTHPEIDFLYSDWIDWEDRPQGGIAATYPPGWAFGFGAHASEIVDGRRVPVAMAPPLTWETVRHIVATPNHVRAWRADAYRRLGGHDPELPVGDDYELVLRTFLNCTTARIPRPLYVQHHDPRGTNASRKRNAEIQRRVGDVAASYQESIDNRCVSLGVTPSPEAPLTGREPLRCANAMIDAVAEGAADCGTPLVSVVVPTYRRPELLKRALESVLAQTYENLEVLVVGDRCPSVDEIIGSIGDWRVRHSNLPTHHGDGGASPRNFALKVMARGTLIAYLDDDNQWRRDHLESLVDLLARNPARTFAFASLEFGGETIICRRPRLMQIDTSALLHRSFLLERFGYWRGLHEGPWGVAHDWELVSRWDGEPWAASLKPTVSYTLEQSQRGERLLEAVIGVAEEERRAALAAPSP